MTRPTAPAGPPSVARGRRGLAWRPAAHPPYRGGGLDPAFNGGLGFVEVGGPQNDSLSAVRVDAQGRIVAAGTLGLPGSDEADQVVYRFESE